VNGQRVYADASHVQTTVSVEMKPGQLDASDLHAWSDLSAKLQKVPALKAYGYTLEGDVAWAKGDATAATQAYESASAIRPSPVTQKKIEAVKLSKSRKVHH
jgi:predicted negative regulator of RcsB-dependent stress response